MGLQPLPKMHQVLLAWVLLSALESLDTRSEWGLVAAGEVGVRVGVWVWVRDSAAPVLAGQSSTFQSATGHHVTLGMPALCKAASPRHPAPICQVSWPRGPRQAPLTTLPPRVLPARRACVH